MIKEIAITNFYSIESKQTISFSINKKDMLDDSSFLSSRGNRLNKIVALIGNNGSGKTNLLKGLSFLLWFANSSYQYIENGKKILIQPHKMAKDQNSRFEMVFEQNNVEYLYKLELNSSQVLYEFLGRKKQRGYVAIYEIRRGKVKDDFSKWNLGQLNEDDKKRFESRKNSSLFSFLLSTGHLPAIGIKSLERYTTNLGQLGLSIPDKLGMFFEISNVLRDNKKQKEEILSYLKECGLGIDDFVSREILLRPKEKEIITTESEKIEGLAIQHVANGKKFDLLFLEESNGTQNIIYLLNKILPILKTGGILIYDEIENSIHPYIIRKLINLLADKKINPNNAQLIFSTHQPWLLDDRTKTQIYIVEKNENLETEMFRLDDIDGIRNDDNYCAKYLAGAYGGVAQMRWF